MLFRKILSRFGLLRDATTATVAPLSSTPRNKKKSEPPSDITLTVAAKDEDSLHSENKVPTVRLRQELADAFNEAFSYEIKTMGVFSDAEISDMLSFINNCDHGFPNLAAWVKPIYEKYFDREWHWPVYDDFMKWRGGESNSDKYEIFKQLVGYIQGKANSIDTLNTYKKYGGWINSAGEEEKLGVRFYSELAERYGSIILKNNPDALPPFYPGDMSVLTSMDR